MVVLTTKRDRIQVSPAGKRKTGRAERVGRRAARSPLGERRIAAPAVRNSAKAMR
jgi:hypothetical protein